MRLLIDTNIFLEVLLEQERAEEARKLLNKTKEHDFFASDFGVHTAGVNLAALQPGEMGLVVRAAQ